MKKIALVILALVWISSLVVLIIAVTDLYPDNPLKEYRLIIGIGFIAISGLIGKAYQHILKIKKEN